MRNKKRNRIFLLLILLLGISIGFAALATTLKINGNASITKNTWNIYWANIGNEQGVTPAEGYETSIGPDENDVPASLVTWTVTFEKPGDYYEFQVDAVNAGTIDAEILQIEKWYNGSPISAQNALPSYLKYTVVYADTGEPAVGDRLAKRTDSTHFTSKRYKIKVEYDRNAVTNSDVNNQSGDVTHTFSFKVKYGQATAPTADIEVVKNDPTSPTPQPGDKVKVKATDKDTQDFYIISSDAQNTVLLAKYNLLVGNEVSNYDVTGQVSSSTAGYNLQSSTATAYDSNSQSYVGTTNFRSSISGNYGFWMNEQGNELLAKYTENGFVSINIGQDGYPEKVGGTTSSTGYFINTNGVEDFPYVYDEDSTIYPYVQTYVSKLKTDYNMPSTITGRLLSWEEAQATKDVLDSGTSIIYTGTQSYWLGSVKEHYHNVLAVQAGNSPTLTTMYAENNDYMLGVRPVIVVPTSILN